VFLPSLRGLCQSISAAVLAATNVTSLDGI
jgi:hypothetical protein